jgi:hypothetical protein
LRKRHPENGYIQREQLMPQKEIMEAGKIIGGSISVFRIPAGYKPGATQAKPAFAG